MSEINIDKMVKDLFRKAEEDPWDFDDIPEPDPEALKLMRITSPWMFEEDDHANQGTERG